VNVPSILKNVLKFMNQQVRRYDESLSYDIMGVGGMVILDLCRVEATIEQNCIAIIDNASFLPCLNTETEADKL
jgi:hypothetical protein